MLQEFYWAYKTIKYLSVITLIKGIDIWIFNARNVGCLSVNQDENLWRKPINLLKFFLTKQKTNSNKTKQNQT